MHRKPLKDLLSLMLFSLFLLLTYLENPMPISADTCIKRVLSSVVCANLSY
jgi:hypothetical protein